MCHYQDQPENENIIFYETQKMILAKYSGSDETHV
jgi:hypothetical protein